MMRVLSRFVSVFVLVVLCHGSVAAQDDEPKTIRIKKESYLSKAQFDNTDLRLFAIDRFGNPRDNRIVSYKLYVKTRKGTREFRGNSNSLSPEMVSCLTKLKESAKIFFTEIVVIDDNEHPMRLPDLIEVWFPDCANCVPSKKGR